MSRKKALKDKHKEMVTKTLAEMKKQSEGDEGLEEKHDQVQEAYKTSEQQLRDDLVRVAYNNPEIREDILPLVLESYKESKIYSPNIRGLQQLKKEFEDAASRIIQQLGNADLLNTRRGSDFKTFTDKAVIQLGHIIDKYDVDPDNF